MEELKELIKKRADIDRKIGLRKIQRSIEMIKEGIDPNNIEELTISDAELGGFLSLLEDKDYYHQTRYYGELGDQTVRSGFYFMNNGIWIGIIQDYDEHDEENGRITILEEAPSRYYDYDEEYEEDKEAIEFVENAVDIDLDLLEKKFNLTSDKNIHQDIENETTYEEASTNLENLTEEELSNMLKSIEINNKAKEEELKSIQKRKLIAQIIQEQQKGRVLDAQIRDAKSQNRGE